MELVPAELWPVLRKHGLRYRDEVVTRTRHAIDQAADFGVPKVLTELGRYAAGKRLTLCLEQLNTRDTSHPMKGHPRSQGDNLDYCAEIVKRVGLPNVKLLFDIYHAEIMNGDVVRRLRQYRDTVGHEHTAGNADVARSGVCGVCGQEFIPTGDPVEGLGEAAALCDVG